MLPQRRGLGEFARNEDGVFAILFGIMAVVLVALAGAAIDYTIWMSARTTAQTALDAGVLAAAASSATQPDDIETIIAGFTTPSMVEYGGVTIENAAYDPATRQVTADVVTTIPTNFVQLVGVMTLPVNARSVAERATNGQLELALVLDNTWSMSDGDGYGTTKIQALKNASHLLIDTLWAEENENIRVGIVPYGEYVNVGLSNRNQPWMSVAEDKVTTTTTTTPRTCETRTTKQVCTKGPKQTCTRYRDGVPESYDCTPQTCTTQTVAPYEVCTGGTSTSTSTSKWFGCVLSRTPRNLRLSDAEPFTPYIGFMQSSQTCMTPILPLTNDVAPIRAAINGMTPKSSTPYTYIPAGMVWGINVVSPTEPFVEGAAYDANNREPRKAIVLMTDGDNTLYYNTNGQHPQFGSNATTAATRKTNTDNDTVSLCTYAKSKNIEVFTVSFGAILPASSTMLQKCATSAEHYFAATSAQDLAEAFEKIADKLRVVRLVQ